jgi:hypothetical protein
VLIVEIVELLVERRVSILRVLTTQITEIIDEVLCFFLVLIADVSGLNLTPFRTRSGYARAKPLLALRDKPAELSRIGLNSQIIIWSPLFRLNRCIRIILNLGDVTLLPIQDRHS